MKLEKYFFICFVVFNFSLIQLHAQITPPLSSVAYSARDSTLFAYKPLFNGTDRSIMTTKKFNIALVNFSQGGADISGNNIYSQATQIATSKYYGLADSYNYDYFTGYREWGYNIHHLSSGNHGFTTQPTNASDAYAQLKQLYLKNVALSVNHPTPNNYLLALTGHYSYHHYAAAWDPNVDIIGIEIGENISSINANIAFCRGASRQFNKYMGIDFSPWWGSHIRDYTQSWVKVAETVENYQIYDSRIGVIQIGGSLSVKDGGIDANYQVIATDAAQFCMNSTRFAYINKTGACYVRDDLSNPWVLVATDVTKVSLNNGNRIAITKSDKEFYVKEGAISANWVHMAGTVEQFQLEGNRVGIVQTNGNLVIKDGSLNSNWYNGVDSNVKNFQLSGTRIASLENNGNFYVKDGSPDANWAITDNNVRIFYLDGSRVAKINTDGNLYVKDGNLNATWSLLASNATDVKLSENRVAVVTTNGALSVKEGDLNTNWVRLFDLQQNFQLSPTQYLSGIPIPIQSARIAVRWPDGKLFVKDGDLFNIQGQVKPFWADGSPIGGHSFSLTKRAYYNSYMAGASVLYPEGGSTNYFQTSEVLNPGSSGIFILSSMGLVGKDIYNFSHSTLPQRGIPWAPVGLMLNTAHGLGFESWKQNKVFGGSLDMNTKDYMNLNLLQSIWGQSLTEQPFNSSDESTYLQNNNYGEIFDVLTDSASSAVIKQYPIIILSGNIDTSSTALTKRLTDYVKAGGNLVLNVSHLNVGLQKLAGVYKTEVLKGVSFDKLIWTGDAAATSVSFKADLQTIQASANDSAKSLMQGGNWSARLSYNLAWIKKIGLGNAITVAFPDLQNQTAWQFIIAKLTKDPAIKPFTVSPGVEYLFNYNTNEWIITLINNSGESKGYNTNDNIDLSQQKLITVNLQDPNVTISAVTDVTIGKSIAYSNGSFSVTVPAADVKVIRVATTKKKTTSQTSNEKSFATEGLYFAEPQEIFVYPNPIVNVANLSKVFNNVDIYDMKGILLNGLQNVSSIDFQNYPQGMYIVRLTDENCAQKSIKVMK